MTNGIASEALKHVNQVPLGDDHTHRDWQRETPQGEADFVIAGKVTWLGIALAAAFWLADAALHAFLMHQGSLATQIYAPEPMIAGMRAFPVLLAVVLGTYAQRTITERQRVEAELRESEERTRLIIETANGAFIAMDAGGRITGWNTQAETIFGWPRSEALGRGLTDVIVFSHSAHTQENGLERLLETGDGSLPNERMEVAVRHRDGHEFPVELAVWAVRTGGSYTLAACAHDITERKRAEDALRESRERYRHLFEEAPVPLLYAGVDGCIQAANACALQLTGYALDDLVGRPISDLYGDTPEVREASGRVFLRFLAGQEAQGEEMQM